MGITLDLIGLVVSDMAASLAFYRTLGLDIPEGVEHEPHVEITLPNGLRLAWDALSMIQSIYPDWETNVRGNRSALAFLCGSAAEVDATYERLTAAGYHGKKAPWDAFWGQRYAVVSDPDGNHLDLFAPLG